MTSPPPAWFKEYRPGQEQAVQETIDHFESGAKVVFLEAPTGSGKTIIADQVRRAFAPNSFIYTCTTKTLQRQVAKDFPYADVLWGRRNYPTVNGPEWVTAADCTGDKEELPACSQCPSDKTGFDYHCYWCHPTMNCPYQIARQVALDSEMPVLNFAYLMTVWNGPGWFRGRKLVVIDEADALEENAMSMVEVEFSSRMMNDLRIGPPTRKTVPKSWYDWAQDLALPALRHEIERLERSIASSGERVDVREIGRLRRFSTAYGNLKAATSNLVIQDDGTALSELEAEWVLSQYESKYGVKLTFRPVKVDRHMPKMLWPHANHFLLMSATIISAQQMADDLGLEDHEWAYVSVDSSFPIERRPVFVEPAGSMTMKTKETGEWEKVTRATAKVIENNPGVRILVHTVSYDLTRRIEEAIEEHTPAEAHRVFSYMNAEERLKALDSYLARPDGVLLASSFQRGVDLHEDACRVIVIPKVPFPFLGDAQVKKRLFGGGIAGERWYQMITVRTICQMTGRGMRSEEDFCETYILDNQFLRIWRENRYLFPKWWAIAVVTDRNDPKFRKGREAL